MSIQENVRNDQNDPQESAWRRRFVLDWKDIEHYSNCLNEYEDAACLLITNFIGYLPLPMIYMPYETFVRALIAAYKQGNIPKETFFKEVEFYAKKIRNDDLKKHGWTEKSRFDEEDYKYYETHLPQFRQAAKDRLIRFLEYEPPIEQSLSAEIFLRQFVMADDYHIEMPACYFDYRARTIFKYREYCGDSGIEAGDECPLVGLQIAELIEISKDDLLWLNLFD